MSLKAAFDLLLEDYSSAKERPLAADGLADFIRNEIPAIVRSQVSDSGRYLVQGSPGKGNWAQVPWIAVFDLLVTDTAREGYYVAYLVNEDCSGLHLSLNQGVTNVRSEYEAGTKAALRGRAAELLARLNLSSTRFAVGQIDLAVSSSSSLGSDYEVGSVCSVFYPKDQIPDDQVLYKDLTEFLELYRSLSDKEAGLIATQLIDPDEEKLFSEDLTRLRAHKRLERNRSLIERVKKIHGYICEACGFDFEVMYGAIGRGFIEAHHLSPLHLSLGQRVTLDPSSDFAVLCSNCHRMIHRSDHVGDIAAFQASLLRTTTGGTTGPA